MKITEFLVTSGVAKSNREAKELIAAGAITINFERLDSRTKNVFIIKEKIIFTT